MLSERDFSHATHRAPRYDLRRRLLERRRALLDDIRSRVKDVRDVGQQRHHYTSDLRDVVDVEPEDDVIFALLTMKAETLVRVDEAVRRLDEGTYGRCLDCQDTISPSRLRALPFAVRCRHCEEAKEGERRREPCRSTRLSFAPGRRS